MKALKIIETLKDDYYDCFERGLAEYNSWKEFDEAIQEIKTLQQEVKQGQDNYNKLWDMYSKLKKEDKELKALLPTDIDTANVWTWKKKEAK